MKGSRQKSWSLLLMPSFALTAPSVRAAFASASPSWRKKAQSKSRSKQLEDALRVYDQTSVLPAPAEFGLGPRPPEEEK